MLLILDRICSVVASNFNGGLFVVGASSLRGSGDFHSLLVPVD